MSRMVDKFVCSKESVEETGFYSSECKITPAVRPQKFFSIVNEPLNPINTGLFGPL